MPEHGTVECFDAGCRRPVCVYAQTVRVEAARRANVEAITASMIQAPPAVDPPAGEPSNDQPIEEPTP